MHEKILKFRKNSWNKNNYNPQLISTLRKDRDNLLNKISKLFDDMASLTFAKDKIFEEISL